jgi:lysozyme
VRNSTTSAFRCLSIGLALLLAFAGLDIAQSRSLRDHKPHRGVKAAHAMPVQGIDVSYWQGEIDWQTVRSAGIRFAYIKATEGGDHLDP